MDIDRNKKSTDATMSILRWLLPTGVTDTAKTIVYRSRTVVTDAIYGWSYTSLGHRHEFTPDPNLVYYDDGGGDGNPSMSNSVTNTRRDMDNIDSNSKNNGRVTGNGVLHIPEIVSIILSYCDFPELVVSCRVCRMWSLLALPRLYHAVTIVGPGKGAEMACRRLSDTVDPDTKKLRQDAKTNQCDVVVVGTHLTVVPVTVDTTSVSGFVAMDSVATSATASTRTDAPTSPTPASPPITPDTLDTDDADGVDTAKSDTLSWLTKYVFFHTIDYYMCIAFAHGLTAAVSIAMSDMALFLNNVDLARISGAVKHEMRRLYKSNFAGLGVPVTSNGLVSSLFSMVWPVNAQRDSVTGPRCKSLGSVPTRLRTPTSISYFPSLATHASNVNHYRSVYQRHVGRASTIIDTQLYRITTPSTYPIVSPPLFRISTNNYAISSHATDTHTTISTHTKSMTNTRLMSRRLPEIPVWAASHDMNMGCLVTRFECSRLVVSDHVLTRLFRCMTQLTHVTVTDCPLVTSQSLKVVASSNTRRLVYVSLSNLPQVDDETLHALAMCCGGLQYLSVVDCPLMTYSGLMDVFFKCRELRSVAVESWLAAGGAGGRRFGGPTAAAAVTAIALAAGGTPMHTGATSIYTVASSSMTIAASMMVMEMPPPVIGGGGAALHLDNVAMTLLAQNCDRLEHVNLSGCRIRMRDLASLFRQRRPTLKSLVLSFGHMRTRTLDLVAKQIHSITGDHVMGCMIMSSQMMLFRLTSGFDFAIAVSPAENLERFYPWTHMVPWDTATVMRLRELKATQFPRCAKVFPQVHFPSIVATGDRGWMPTIYVTPTGREPIRGVNTAEEPETNAYHNSLVRLIDHPIITHASSA